MMLGGCLPARWAAHRLEPVSVTVCCREAPLAASPAAAAPVPVCQAAPAVPAMLVTDSTTYLGRLEQMADQLATRRNALGQPIGEPLDQWSAPPVPQRLSMNGHWCALEPLTAELHASGLWDAYRLDTDGRNWTYLVHGPYDSFAEFTAWARRASASQDPLFFAILDRDRRPVGVAAYLRIAPEAGSIEIGHINLSPLLQRTPAATEAMFLLMKHAFELGYRRYEWKCDALNEASRAAAERLGFTFEGIFRQATIYKGRSRDTAWYSIIDREWPALRDAFERWLAPANFDAGGRQRTRLSELISSVRMSRSRV